MSDAINVFSFFLFKLNICIYLRDTKVSLVISLVNYTFLPKKKKTITNLFLCIAENIMAIKLDRTNAKPMPLSGVPPLYSSECSETFRF